MEECRQQLQQAVAGDEKLVSVVEVCGFHDWLVKWLRQDQRCHDVLVAQPLGRSPSKTDRRDAHGLSELLWVDRERLLRGYRVHGVRTVQVPSDEDQDSNVVRLGVTLQRSIGIMGSRPSRMMTFIPSLSWEANQWGRAADVNSWRTWVEAC
jgi:hypothetical protein